MADDLVGTGVSDTGVDLDGRADQGVLGTNVEIAEIETVTLQGVAAQADSAAVPLRVDAGEGGVFRDVATAPLTLLIAGLGILLAMAGAMARRRTGAAHTG